jgi:hypothetical protein
MKTLHDIYRCADCSFIAAHGNKYCRGCGLHFSAADIAKMKTNNKTSIGASPWNLRDRFRCVHCSEHIAMTDSYCRGCGDQIDNQEKQLMRLGLDELAAQNMPSLIGLAAFVLCILAGLMLT